MIHRLALLTCLLGAVLLSIPMLHAQGDGAIAYTCPPMPPDPNLSKVTLFRLFYVGGKKAPSIALAREPKGGSATLIEGHLTPGTFSSYVMMRPDRFKLHILDGNVAADSDKPLALEEKKLAEPIEAELPAGGSRTLIVQEHDGKLSATLTTDTHPDSGALPTMRVLDLSGLPDWSIHLVSRANKLVKTLWRSGEATENIGLPNHGVYLVMVTRKTGDQVRHVATFECELNKGVAFSVLLLPGFSNQGQASFVFDATLGNSYDAATVKAVAEGPGIQP